eukprot:11235-Heterococcus_DN1.PRE.1
MHALLSVKLVIVASATATARAVVTAACCSSNSRALLALLLLYCCCCCYCAATVLLLLVVHTVVTAHQCSVWLTVTLKRGRPDLAEEVEHLIAQHHAHAHSEMGMQRSAGVTGSGTLSHSRLATTSTLSLLHANVMICWRKLGHYVCEHNEYTALQCNERALVTVRVLTASFHVCDCAQHCSRHNGFKLFGNFEGLLDTLKTNKQLRSEVCDCLSVSTTYHEYSASCVLTCHHTTPRRLFAQQQYLLLVALSLSTACTVEEHVREGESDRYAVVYCGATDAVGLSLRETCTKLGVQFSWESFGS